LDERLAVAHTTLGERPDAELKRAIYIEVLAEAHKVADENVLAALEKKQRRSEIRQGRIYFEGLKEAERKGIPKERGLREKHANRKLQQAGLRRLDALKPNSVPKRDREIRKMEEEILSRYKTDDDGWQT
jgi:hypothetical protein